MKLNRCGFITNYLISGPKVTDFNEQQSKGQIDSSNQLRYEQYLRTIVAKPCLEEVNCDVKLGMLSPLSLPWEYYYSYGNWFVDKSAFYSTLQYVELDAVTILSVEEAQETEVNIWTYAALTVWCNGEVVCEIKEPVYKPIQQKKVKIKLKQGANPLYIKLQTLGVRDTRTMFGIQVCSTAHDIEVKLPDSAETDKLYHLEQWLAEIKMKDSQLVFPSAAPSGSLLGYDNKSPDYGDKGKRVTWEDVAGKTKVELDKTKPGVLHLTVEYNAHQLVRTFENIQAQVPEYMNISNTEAGWEYCFRQIAKTLSLSRSDKYGFSIANILARKALHMDSSGDDELLWDTLNQIEKRYDCSDFVLCGLLRYIKCYSLTPQLAERAKNVLLNYRYWMNQKGSDAMCFWSENHALTFYTCAMLVGEMYPDEYFWRAGKNGRELSAEARKKVQYWLLDVKQYGFEEYFSSVYMCITFVALLNLIDYADKEISKLASEIADMLFDSLIKHTFDQVVIAPMGRVYREVIYPFKQGGQALLNLIDYERGCREIDSSN